MRAKDEAGNISAPVSRSFTVNSTSQDTTPPETQMYAGPTGTIDYDDVYFAWVGADSSTPVSDLVYSYYLEGYDTGWCKYISSTNNRRYYNLQNGTYTFRVRTKDLAGNVDPTPATRTFTVRVSHSVHVTSVGVHFSDPFIYDYFCEADDSFVNPKKSAELINILESNQDDFTGFACICYSYYIYEEKKTLKHFPSSSHLVTTLILSQR